MRLERTGGRREGDGRVCGGCGVDGTRARRRTGGAGAAPARADPRVRPMCGGLHAPIADAISSAVKPSCESRASTEAPAAMSSPAQASSPCELARISAVIPSISSCTGPYSAQLAAARTPAPLPPPTPSLIALATGAARPTGRGDVAVAADALLALSPQLRSMCVSIKYESATRPRSTAARRASAHTKPCASTHSRGMKRMQQSAQRFMWNSSRSTRRSTDERSRSSSKSASEREPSPAASR
jgi:hypothetical protein